MPATNFDTATYFNADRHEEHIKVKPFTKLQEEQVKINSFIKPKFFQANNLYECQNTNQLIKFYHSALFSPTAQTWIAAIDAGYFRGWPGLTSALVRKHIQVIDATVKGHMNQRRQGLRSTKIKPQHVNDHMEPAQKTPKNVKKQMKPT